MQTFNPKQYLAISIANQGGMDKLPWEDRIQWVKDNYHDLEAKVPESSKEKFLYLKAVKALRDSDAGKSIQYIMDMDATNSGAQIVAAICKCNTTAESSNVIGANRNDIYGKILENIKRVKLSRQQVKEAAIPAFYGSKAEPRNLLKTDARVNAFFKALYKAAPALELMGKVGKLCWNEEAEYHQWTLPDGHVAYCPNIGLNKMRVELASKTSFTYQYSVLEKSENSIPLSVNVIHSLDGYVAREMVRRANQQRFQLAHIHDAFFAQPQWFNHVRANYRNILIELAQSDILNQIAKEINPSFCGVSYTEEDLNMWKKIMDAEYMLS